MIVQADRETALASTLFAGLNTDTVAGLLASAKLLEAAAGTVMFDQGDAPTKLVMVVAGMVKVWRLSPNGTPVTIHMMGPGQLVGCVAAFCGIALPASATAVEPSRLLIWSARDVNALLAQYPALAANALSIVGGRNALFLDRIQDLSSEDAETRIGRALLRLAGDGDQPIVRVSRQELAELTATTLYTVSRVVSEWQRKGWVRGGRQRIAILDPAAMHARYDRNY